MACTGQLRVECVCKVWEGEWVVGGWREEGREGVYRDSPT